MNIFEHDGSKLTVDVVFDSVYSSASRNEISNFKNQQLNFTGLIGNATKFVTLSLTDDDIYEGNETAIFGLENLSNGNLGDFISHTVVIEDDELPEVKMEVIQNQNQSFLLIHNLESKAVDLSKWQINYGDFHYTFKERLTLNVGETQFVTNTENESLPANTIVINEESFKIPISSATIELKNRASKKIADFSFPKEKARETTSLKVLSNNSVPSNTVSTEARVFEENTEELQKATPGWKYLSNSSFGEDFPEMDLYFWSEESSQFQRYENQLILDYDPLLVGYFDEKNAEIYNEKVTKEKANSIELSTLSFSLSATDRNQNERVEGSEGFTLVTNNSNQAILSSELSKQIQSKLLLKSEPQLFKSNIDFSDIRVLNNERIFPEELFWVKLREEVPFQTLEIDVNLITKLRIQKKKIT